MSEHSLKDLQGRYLKFKVKQPAGGGVAPEIALTPLGETLVVHDSSEGFEGFMEDSPEFLAQIEQLNEVWYVFVGMAIVLAVLAFFIHRGLQRRDSVKVDFRSQASQPPASLPPAHF